MILFNILIL